ncbi:DUF2628 domain-containing protein [Candidatus Methylospira mobilis]|nr:DUF2628 domain-containing protein [Candidatus Methylospira mobilis]
MPFCNKCGSDVSDSASFCGACGAPLSTVSDITTQADIHGDVTEADLRLFVGRKYNSYYAEKWKEEDQPKQKSIWWAKRNSKTLNWSAFFLTFFWLAYRKMYKHLFICLAIYIPVVVIVESIAGHSVTWVTMIPSVILLSYANGWYRQFSYEKIKKTKSLGLSRDITALRIEKDGGVSLLSPTLFILIGALTIAVIAAVFYNNSTSSNRIYFSLNQNESAISTSGADINSGKELTTQAYEWNTQDVDVASNGNIKLAVKQLKSNAPITENTQVAADTAWKAPWKYYGQVLCFSGEAALVEDYPPGSDISKVLVSNQTSEVVIETNDGSIVDLLSTNGSGSLKAQETTTVCGFPVGRSEVENKLGGKFTHLVLVGYLKAAAVSTPLSRQAKPAETVPAAMSTQAPIAPTAPVPHVNEPLPGECSEIQSCIEQSLKAARDNNIDIVRHIASRIDSLPKPELGNKVQSRKLNAQGLETFKAGGYNNAAAYFQMALKENPRDAELEANLGSALTEAGRAGEAVTPFLSSLQLDPRRSWTWAPLAEAYVVTGQQDKAVSALLLSYYWSSNREKIANFYKEHAEKDAIQKPDKAAAYRTAYSIVNNGGVNTSSYKITEMGVSSPTTSAKDALGEANKQINIVWNGTTKQNRTLLLPEQREWLKIREQECQILAAKDEPNNFAAQDAARMNCMTAMTHERTRVLRQKIVSMTGGTHG